MEKNPDLEAAAAEQVEKMKPHQERIFFILSIIERLDKVSFGQRVTAYSSIRDFFARNGYVSDKQLALLEKYMYTFRRQIPEPIGV